MVKTSLNVRNSYNNAEVTSWRREPECLFSNRSLSSDSDKGPKHVQSACGH
jgi:hypothetical protein